MTPTGSPVPGQQNSPVLDNAYGRMSSGSHKRVFTLLVGGIVGRRRNGYRHLSFDVVDDSNWHRYAIGCIYHSVFCYAQGRFI